MILICHITSDQNLEDTWNKKCLFPTMTKWTTSGQINLTGTRAEERFTVAKNCQQRWWVWFFLLKLLHCQTYDKRWLGVLPQMQCLVPQIMHWCLRQMAIHFWSMPLSRTESPSDRNCTYRGIFLINGMEFSHFLNNYNIKHFHIKNIWHIESSYIEHISALTVYFVHVFYTLKHVLPKMIKIAPHTIP